MRSGFALVVPILLRAIQCQGVPNVSGAIAAEEASAASADRYFSLSSTTTQSTRPDRQRRLGTVTGKINGKWQQFESKEYVESDVYGCTSSCSTKPNSEGLGSNASPWTFISTNCTRLRVVEGYTTGQAVYTVFVDNVNVGNTSQGMVAINCTSDPDVCYADPNAGKGQWTIAKGSHAVRIIVAHQTVPADAGWFRLDSVNCPTNAPTKVPTKPPTKAPNGAPTKAPTKVPTKAPTKAPTKLPTKAPTKLPTKAPNKAPTKVPTKRPTKNPTKAPTKSPNKAPTKAPTKSPNKTPTKAPTKVPTKSPNKNQTKFPTKSPTKAPIPSTKPPTRSPSTKPPTKPSPTGFASRCISPLRCAQRIRRRRWCKCRGFLNGWTQCLRQRAKTRCCPSRGRDKKYVSYVIKKLKRLCER